LEVIGGARFRARDGNQKSEGQRARVKSIKTKRLAKASSTAGRAWHFKYKGVAAISEQKPHA
jgi:hypothetical protein